VSKADFRVLRNASTGKVVLEHARWCKSFWLRLRGLMFRFNLPEDEGLIFVYGRESRMDTSIHMFFMAFNIASIWLDKDGQVVDKQLAKVWRPFYGSRRPAQYVIEGRPVLLDRVNVGDRLSFS